MQTNKKHEPFFFESCRSRTLMLSMHKQTSDIATRKAEKKENKAESLDRIHHKNSVRHRAK